MLGLSEHSKKARKRMKAGVHPAAAKAREEALKERVRSQRPVDEPVRSRHEVVQAREVKRLERRKADPRFKKDEQVDDATAERTAMRLNRLQGVRPHGINVSDGVTGREARLARNAVAAEKDSRKTIHVTDPVQPGRTRSKDQLRGVKNLEKLASDRVQRLHNSGDRITTPPRPGDKPYTIAATGSVRPRERRRRRAHAIKRSWTQPERYIP